MSSPKSFSSQDRILPKYMDMGVAIVRIFRQYLKFVLSLKYIFLMMSSNYSK